MLILTPESKLYDILSNKPMKIDIDLGLSDILTPESKLYDMLSNKPMKIDIDLGLSAYSNSRK